jgi:hypothetical protein
MRIHADPDPQHGFISTICTEIYSESLFTLKYCGEKSDTLTQACGVVTYLYYARFDHEEVVSNCFRYPCTEGFFEMHDLQGNKAGTVFFRLAKKPFFNGKALA